MPPNLENAAKRLNQEPISQDIRDSFARRMAEGINMQPLLEKLNERTVQVGNIMDQIESLNQTMRTLKEGVEEVSDSQAQEIADKINELNQRAAEEKQKIAEIIRQAPELPLIQQRHWQNIRQKDISREVENLPPQDLVGAFQEEFPRGEKYSDIFKNLDNPDQLEGSMREGLIQQRLQQPKTPLDVLGPLHASSAAAVRILDNPDVNVPETPNIDLSEDPTPNIGENQNPPDGGSENIPPPVSDNPNDPIPHVIVDDVKAIFGQQTVTGSGGTASPGPGPAGGIVAGAAGGKAAGRDTEENIARGFGAEHIQGGTRVFEDLVTPGGPSLARTGTGLAGSALSGAGFLGLLGLPGLAIGAGAATGISTSIGQMEQMRGIERQFGEEQGMFGREGGGGALRAEQIQARLTNPLMGSEEIDSLTSELARLGATAEEAAEALGPATDALSQHRVLTEETAARAARRGQQFSDIGASEAGVLGQVMEALSGGGFSADILNQAAQTSAEVFEPMGGAQGEYGGLGIANLLQSGGSQTDMILETAGTTNKAIEFGGQVLSEPWKLGPAANMYGGGEVDYTQIDPTTVEGQAQANFALPRIVANTAKRYGIRPDPETGKIDPGNGENRRQASLMSQELSTALGIQLEEGEILAMLQTVNQAGGEDKAYEQTLGPMQMAEKERNRVKDEIGGSLAEGARGRANDTLTNTTGSTFDTLSSISPFGAAFEGAAFGLNNLITGKSAIERGQTGSYAATDEWTKAKGYSGTILGTEGQGLFDRGIDPSKVNVVGPKGGEYNLSEVIKNKKLQKRFNQGELLAEVDVGGQTQRMTAEEMATAAYNNELKMDTGFLGVGKDKLTMGNEEGTGKGSVQVEFTGSAEKFFRQVDAKDAGTMAGQTNQAINSDRANRGQIPLSDVMPTYGG